MRCPVDAMPCECDAPWMRCPEDAGEDRPTRISNIAPVQLEHATSAPATSVRRQVGAKVMRNIRRITSPPVKDATSEPCTLGRGRPKSYCSRDLFGWLFRRPGKRTKRGHYPRTYQALGGNTFDFAACIWRT